MTRAKDDTDKATVAFVVANAALGCEQETMVFLPPWAFVRSRCFKAQVPYFSERYRCITYDPRGNGKSDRPEEAAPVAWTCRRSSWANDSISPSASWIRTL